ncbi:hypothetical protein ACNKHR_02315 [Shigella flexneri]
MTLAEKLGCGVNDLPLSLVLSFEQKAIVILLTLLSLGVKNHHRRRRRASFTPDLLAVLDEKFGLEFRDQPLKKTMQQLLSA